MTAAIHEGDRVKCKGKRGTFIVNRIGKTVTLVRIGRDGPSQFHAAYLDDLTVSPPQRRFAAALESAAKSPAIARVVRTGRANDMTDAEIVAALRRVVFGD